MPEDLQTIGGRIKCLVALMLPERRRFVQLEQLSGIPADHWKNFWHDKQRAHEHMIQAAVRHWPEYGFWLVAGYVPAPNQQHKEPYMQQLAHERIERPSSPLSDS